MYADEITDALRNAIDEASRRRDLQDDFNRTHGIIPRTIEKKLQTLLEVKRKTKQKSRELVADLSLPQVPSEDRLDETLRILRQRMTDAADALEYELAALYRDKILALEKKRRSEKRQG